MKPHQKIADCQAQFFNTQLFGTDFSGLYQAARDEVFGERKMPCRETVAERCSSTRGGHVQAVVIDLRSLHTKSVRLPHRHEGGHHRVHRRHRIHRRTDITMSRSELRSMATEG